MDFCFSNDEVKLFLGAKINMDTIGLKLDVVTGKAFVPDSQRWKNIEDITKNINMFAQLHSAVFTAFFTDPLSAGIPVVIYEPMLAYDVPVLLSYVIRL
jgi:hypothetical protein